MSAERQSAVSQAWVEPIADDPEALSALAVARSRLPAARGLARLRRFRVIEIEGALPERAEQEALLHRSTQFYNPHKERLRLRTAPRDADPLDAGEQAVLVLERGGVRRPAAERWWRHETGAAVQVREGVAWVLGFEPDAAAAESARDLAVLRDLRHGIFCNPHAQEARLSASGVPLPWLAETPPRPAARKETR